LIEINLNFNYGYKWYSSNGIYVKGYIFDENNNLFNGKKLIKYFSNMISKNTIEEKLQNANGIFTVIIKKDNLIIMAVDRTRTFPIFYSIKEGELYISDDTYFLKDKTTNKISKDSFDEFLAAGFVTGKETLIENIYQVQAGEYILYKSNRLEYNFYADYLTSCVVNKKKEELKNEFLDILDRTIKRLIKFADGRQIVVPLSGGYDSRLVVALLKKHNYENVFCFTYGSKKSSEVNISKKVACALGYKWYFVEYNEITVSQQYPKNIKFQRFYKFASNHVSLSHIQDYFSVNYLNDNNLISPDAIFVPGHSGDFLGGSHVKKISNIEAVFKRITKKHCILNDLPMKKAFMINKIRGDTNNLDEHIKLYSIDENFNLRERQSKYIVNANRVYEFFGYKHLIPLWDNLLIEFFRNLPLELKLNSLFYEKVIIEDIFSALNVNYLKKRSKYFYQIKAVKSYIKKIIPLKMKLFFQEVAYNDINNFYLFTTPLNRDLKEKYTVRKFKSLFAYWHYKKIK
jgi:asparagine synthase (glutamine-hydrolysing)